ncbi:MAG: hypothetical protein LBR73_00140 [Oscillospiraceae bacterium]|jgi:triacylglycerol lipase|nr:hypothetical protein [Oscillospiraceae bacterium]
MKRRVLSLCLAVSALLLSSQPLSAKTENKMPKAAIVFVHGLGGWGEGTFLDAVWPHWGMGAGSIKNYLESLGYEAHAASVGPISSAWDRACELYAHITGTRTDYGAAHSKAHGHARYGTDYSQALVPDWGADKKLHLIGHSFGGATVRLFVQLCAAGDAAEKKATKAADLSPLFKGGLSKYIISVTTLAAPHNGAKSGSRDMDAVAQTGGGDKSSGLNLSGMFGQMVSIGAYFPLATRIYPFRLEQFGLAPGAAWTNGFSSVAKAGTAFMASGDTAYTDLSVDGAAALNKRIRLQKGIYYFSWASQTTKADKDGNQVPTSAVSAIFQAGSAMTGRKSAAYRTKGGILIDDSWLANDGMVSVVSARYPFTEAHTDYNPKNIKKGIWNCMPLLDKYDHADFCGGPMRLFGAKDIKPFFAEIAEMLSKLPA